MTKRHISRHAPCSDHRPTPDLGEAAGAARPARRLFLQSALRLGGLFGCVQLVYPAAAAINSLTTDHTDASETVNLISFSPAGKRLGKVNEPRVMKSEEDWQRQLSPLQFEVTRHAGTERPFSGDTWNEHRRGLFRCVCCETAVFDSRTKFDSGTGWPSFFEPIARENVREAADSSLGIRRTAVSCRRCEAHLGHVFDDGPRPTGLRYCMNSASLHFVPIS